MARLMAEFYFELEHLVAKPEILGQVSTFKRGRFDCEIWSPANKDEFPSDDGFERQLVDIGLTMGELPAIRFRLSFRSDLSAAAFDANDSAARQEAMQLLHEAFAEASAMLAELLQWTRIRGQVWLNSHPDLIKLFLPATLRDEDAGRSLPVELPRSYRPPQVPRAAAIDRAFFETIPGRLGDNGQRPPLPETLIADARQLADEIPPDLDKAVLTAAIACEAKVKQTLRSCSVRELTPMVDLFLSSPRDWSVAAIRLYDDVMKVVLKRSLKDEDRALWRRVEKLFTHRNTIAHAKDKRPSESDLRDVVDAAKEALEWLDDVQRSSTLGNRPPR